MKEYKIVIDASHGGNDVGLTDNGIVEKDYSLLISNYIYDKLKKMGFDVYMTRTNDETLSNDERIERALKPFGSNNNVIIISNHLNDGNEEGVEIVYALRNNNILPNDIADAMEKNNLKVLKVFQRRLPSDTAKDYYFIHRDTKNTIPVSIYYGYINNSTDAQNLKNNYKIYGDSVVDGIALFIGENQFNNYIVQAGDSLWSISKKFGITVDDLKKANNLTSNLLSIGMKLNIPINNETIEENNIYIVKSGDTLYSIANKYGITVLELKKYNNLTSDILNIGQKLNIPTSVNNSNNYITYVVTKGDSLYSIAKKYNTTVSEIMTLNNLKTNLLSIGQILKIPISKNEVVYIVQAGDNLYSIAKKYNTTIENIKNKNNLTSNVLSIGQKLII